MADTDKQLAGRHMATAAAPAKTPNLYQVSGPHLHVTFSTSGFDGRPHFTYQDASRTLSFTGDQIRSTGTEIGTLVSVTIFTTVDAGSTSFTLLVPHVDLGQSDQAPITTEGITTIHRFSIVPVFNHGQRELYSVSPLTGTASFVHF